MVRGGIKFGITGVAASVAFIVARDNAIQSALKKQIKKSTNELKEEVKDSIRGIKAEPRSIDTGEFLNSVEGRAKDFVGIVSSDVPQALFMEFGTSKTHERRHFRNSLARKKRKIEEDLDRAVKDII